MLAMRAGRAPQTVKNCPYAGQAVPRARRMGCKYPQIKAAAVMQPHPPGAVRAALPKGRLYPESLSRAWEILF